MKIHPQHSVARLALAAMASLIVSLAPTAASAAPPATVASCDGIKDAYPILGTQCANNYAKINHAPATPAERSETYYARVAVMEIFRKALLCNGLYGATTSAQQSFASGVNGHLQALGLLNTAMTNAHDPNVPAVYTDAKLQLITVNKPQCK